MPPPRKSFLPVLILGILFFIFGFVTWLNGTLIPYLKIACELNTQQSLLVAFAFYISYFVMALPSSAVLKRTGYKRGMMLGLIVMAAGALLFVPAAHTRTYGLFLLGLFVIGTGLSILQTASNPYITIAGPIESAARRISIMGICNKVAGVLAPLILGAIVLHDADSLTESLAAMDAGQQVLKLDELASRVVTPYTWMCVVLLALAVYVRLSPLPELEATDDEVTNEPGEQRTHVFGFPNLVFGAIGIFVYVGAEVVAGDTIGLYGQSEGIALSQAKNFTSFTLAAMVIGYIAGIVAIPRYISQHKALSISAMVGILFSVLIMTTRGYVSVLFVALLGLANALVWPAIWPLALRGLGRFTKTGSAILIMGIAGGALLPLLYGWLADGTTGHRLGYGILVPCYLFIWWFAERGYRKTSW